MGHPLPRSRYKTAASYAHTVPNFALVDVETANSWQGSICQIGICHVEAGKIADTWQTLVDPQEPFDRGCMRVHGITPEQVEGAPVWSDIFPEVQRRLSGLVVSHGSFDKSALQEACHRYCLCPLQCLEWRDSATLIRRTWPERYSRRGYALHKLAADFGLALRHHDALADAICAAQIVLKAFAAGATMDLWRHGQTRRRGWSPYVYTPACRQDGPLGAQLLVFTGRMSLPRRAAVRLVTSLGGSVGTRVTSHTTALVVAPRPGGPNISSKESRAMELVAQGHHIRLLSEAEFHVWVGTDPAS